MPCLLAPEQSWCKYVDGVSRDPDAHGRLGRSWLVLTGTCKSQRDTLTEGTHEDLAHTHVVLLLVSNDIGLLLVLLQPQQSTAHSRA